MFEPVSRHGKLRFMANENKKINELVSDEDETTAELDVSELRAAAVRIGFRSTDPQRGQRRHGKYADHFGIAT